MWAPDFISPFPAKEDELPNRPVPSDLWYKGEAATPLPLGSVAGHQPAFPCATPDSVLTSYFYSAGLLHVTFGKIFII